MSKYRIAEFLTARTGGRPVPGKIIWLLTSFSAKETYF